MKMTGEGIGFGKAILFNEHFVVYGVPAVVSAIGKYTVAKIESVNQSGWKLNDNRKATPKYKKDKIDQQKDSIDRIIKKMGIELYKKGVEITLEGKLYCASGIGASAASCVSLARALAQHYNLDIPDGVP